MIRDLVRTGGRLGVAAGLLLVGLSLGTRAAASAAPVQLSLAKDIQLVSEERSVGGARFSFLGSLNQDVRGVDLGVFSARTAETQAGAQVGFGVLRVGEGLDGVQASLVSATSGACRGVQAASIWSQARGPLVGVQSSFGVARIDEDLRGYQSGLAWAAVRGDLKGVQSSLWVAEADQTVRGLQLAGLGAVAEDVGGLQASAFNLTGGELSGLQLGLLSWASVAGGAQVGLVSVAEEKASGIQLGLLLNVAEQLRGMQVGLVNVVTERSDEERVQLGLLNFNPSGFLPFFPIVNLTN